MRKVMFNIITNPERPEHSISMPVNVDLVCNIVPVPIKGQTVGPKGEPTIKLVAGLNFSGYVLPVHHSIQDATDMVFGKDVKPGDPDLPSNKSIIQNYNHKQTP